LQAKGFSRAAMGAEAAIVEEGVKQAQRFLTLAGAMAASNQFDHGWQYPKPDLGDFGDDFRYRALVALAGIGALPPAEAMYMRAEGNDGQVFNGDGLYRLALPRPIPAEGFWSLSMYEATDDDQFFFTENPIKRYSIGDRTRGVKKNAGGGLDIWISRTDPGGEKSANWLPAPTSGPFAMILRAYLPKPELLTGRYKLPPIVRV
jgi:hypothetical protein